jgi:predicted RNase H-like HicB family nuclease
MRTYKKSKRSSAKRSAPDRPFDDRVFNEARRVVSSYRLILELDEGLGYVGSSVEVPTVMADGKTPDECVRATREALAVAVATMLEMGRRPPSGRATRSVQVNLRLTAEEKLALEAAANRMGFKGISDFVRAAAMERTQRN